MKHLGLESTFLAGFFYAGAPQLKIYKTPSNQRTDVTTDPDTYSQTTSAEVGQLLADIYECSQLGGGTLLAALEDEITQEECQMMLQNLKNDHTPALIPAGVPDGSRWRTTRLGIGCLWDHPQYERRGDRFLPRAAITCFPFSYPSVQLRL
jgi:hypothetical protein